MCNFLKVRERENTDGIRKKKKKKNHRWDLYIYIYNSTNTLRIRTQCICLSMQMQMQSVPIIFSHFSIAPSHALAHASALLPMTVKIQCSSRKATIPYPKLDAVPMWIHLLAYEEYLY